MPDNSTPAPLCKCGCGHPTTVIQQTKTWRGYVAGEYYEYLQGHASRRHRKMCVDCGAECRIQCVRCPDCAAKRRKPDYVIDESTGCWNWQKKKTRDGYGDAKRDGRSIGAHRWYYIQVKGNIPDGLQIDHLCNNRACVNPDHLEPVTGLENQRRAIKRRSQQAV